MKIDGQTLYDAVADTWCRKCEEDSSDCKDCPVSKYLNEIIEKMGENNED